MSMYKCAAARAGLAALLCVMLTGPRLLQAEEGGSESHVEQDRQAILAMAGEYAVGFKFQETVILKPGYQRKLAKDSGAYEKVFVVEQMPNKIVLQHLLVSDKGMVTKHWRQDWLYEAKERLEFAEDQVWRVKPIASDHIRRHWTQCVYEVTDAPRYCGTGEWQYVDGQATWTSDPSWRPLPRREYTTRNDYNALRAVNRHTLTPAGWTHEQDNSKVVRAGEKVQSVIVREVGFNEYVKTSQVNFQPVDTYWQKTAGFWAGVRARWEGYVQQHQCIQLKFDLNDIRLIQVAFAQAEHLMQGKAADETALDGAFATLVSGCQ